MSSRRKVTFNPSTYEPIPTFQCPICKHRNIKPYHRKVLPCESCSKSVCELCYIISWQGLVRTITCTNCHTKETQTGGTYILVINNSYSYPSCINFVDR